ncbi:RING finger protein 222 [Lampris incognitus]|uniref:RING finger protein 222 n=1 Tax=Lampris incognitus TaxID=2546036 RepID=UPI0024B48376|nr:RING finger protein 222 [Lampris incognitus]
MAFHMQKAREDSEDSECPVCYECLPDSKRTLSCGHVFCHDCLVKTLVSVHGDGVVRDTIVCPICRHLTFIKKQKADAESLIGEKDGGERQTLEVPVPLPPGDAHLRSASADALPAGFNRALRCLRGVSERVRRQRVVGPGQNDSQIFVISAQGRPMAEEEAVGVVVTVVRQRLHPRRRVCTAGRCLLLLLSIFTILALVAATLPWILLA